MIDAADFLKWCDVFRIRTGGSAGAVTSVGLINAAGSPVNQTGAVTVNANFVPQASYSPVNFTAAAGTGFAVNSLTAMIKGIDLALSDSGGTPIAELLWVNDASGNDANNGTINSPYKTYSAAAAHAVLTASASNLILIKIIGALTITGDMTLYPFVYIDGENTGTIHVTDQLLLDNTFNTLNFPTCIVRNLTIDVDNGIDLQFTVSKRAVLYFNNTYFLNTPTFNVTGTASSNAESVIINGYFTSGNVTDVTIDSANFICKGTQFNSISYINVHATNAYTLYLDDATVNSSLSINSVAGGNVLCTILSSNVAALSLTGGNASVTIDSTSYKFIPTFASGAVITNIQIVSNSDGVPQTSYTPVNFTPQGTSQYRDDSVTAMIAGIDEALGEIIAINEVYGEMYFTANATPTTISSMNTPVIISGTYVAGNLLGFTLNTNELKKTDAGTHQCNIICQVSASYSGASNDSTLYIAKNGTVVAKSSLPILLGGITPAAAPITFGCLESLDQNDTISAFIENNNSTDDPTVYSINCRVNSIIEGGGGGGIQIEQQLWVSFENGDDTTGNGDINSPFKTYDMARSIAVMGASASTPYVIKTIGVQNITGDMEIEPYVDIEGGIYNATGDVKLSSAWTSVVGSTKVSNCQFNPDNVLTFTFGGGFASSLIMSDIIMGGSNPGIVIFTGTGTEDVTLNNFSIDPTAITSYGLTITSMFRADLRDLDPIETLSVTATSSASNDCVTNLYNTTCTTTNMQSASASSQDQTLNAYASPLGIVTVGPGVLGSNASILNITNDSLTEGSSVTTQNGGVINLIGSAGSVNAGFTPSSYTPTTGDLSDSVKNHLEGIDGALSSSGDYTPTITPQLNCGTASLDNAQYYGMSSAVGASVIVSVQLQITPGATTFNFKFSVPLGSNFSGSTSAVMMGSQIYDTATKAILGQVIQATSQIGDAAIQVFGRVPGGLVGNPITLFVSASYVIQ